MTTSHVIKPLTPETFPAWLALAQKHNGVWGGCWLFPDEGVGRTGASVRR